MRTCLCVFINMYINEVFKDRCWLLWRVSFIYFYDFVSSLKAEPKLCWPLRNWRFRLLAMQRSSRCVDIDRYLSLRIPQNYLTRFTNLRIHRFSDKSKICDRYAVLQTSVANTARILLRVTFRKRYFAWFDNSSSVFSSIFKPRTLVTRYLSETRAFVPFAGNVSDAWLFLRHSNYLAPPHRISK